MRRALGQAVKGLAAAVDVLRPSTSGVAVLIYHRVGRRTPVSVDLARATFADQMAFLAGSYAPMSLDAAASALQAGAPPQGRPPVVVTFDDGTADFVDEALPVLVEYGVPAILYVATDHIERGIPFPDDGVAVSWAGLADAAATGLVTIGSHTHTHRLLDRVDAAVAAEELDRSTELIGERLGVRAEHFAYPKAVLGSPAAEEEVRRRFTTAAVAGSRLNPWSSADLHRLTRIPIQTTDGMRWFKHKVASGLRLEDDLRTLVNRRRYAGATT